MLTARIASIRPDLVRTWTGLDGPIDPDYKWYEIAKIWQTPGEGERWMAELELNAFAAQLTSDFKVPSEDARTVVRHFDDAMKASPNAGFTDRGYRCAVTSYLIEWTKDSVD